MAENNNPPGNQPPIVTVSDLLDDEDVMTQLATLMDNYHQNNHIRLGEYLLEQRIITGDNLQEKFRALQRFFHGGGSPTLAFLEKNGVNHPNDLVKKFRDFAKKKGREDVIKVIESYEDNKLLTSLADAHRAEIADLLDRRIVGAADWSSFASHFGFNHDERQVFNAVTVVPGSFSPTRALIQKLKQLNGTLPIQKIIQWAESEGRNDINSNLTNFIAKKTREWRENQDNQPHQNNHQPSDNDLGRVALVLNTAPICVPSSSSVPSESDDPLFMSAAEVLPTQAMSDLNVNDEGDSPPINTDEKDSQPDHDEEDSAPDPNEGVDLT